MFVTGFGHEHMLRFGHEHMLGFGHERVRGVSFEPLGFAFGGAGKSHSGSYPAATATSRTFDPSLFTPRILLPKSEIIRFLADCNMSRISRNSCPQMLISLSASCRFGLMPKSTKVNMSNSVVEIDMYFENRKACSKNLEFCREL